MNPDSPRPALLLAHDFPPIGGGIARALGELARHAGEGRLVVSTGREPGSMAFDTTCMARVDRVEVPSARLRHITGLARWAWRARSLVREVAPGFMWAGNLKPAGHVARWLGAREDLPYGLMVYGLDLQRVRQQAERSSTKRRAARAIVGSAAGTVAISGWTAALYRELALALDLPAAAERVQVVRLGVDSARFRPAADRAALRRSLGLGEGRWAITVARLVPHKGVDVALAAIAELERQGEALNYLVVGEGPERAPLERRAQELGIAARVRWLGGVSDTELADCYAAADLYLGLSREDGPQVEGFGLALLEAQAAGLPVVAGRSGGTADAVADGRTGLLVSPTDVAAVVAAAQSLLQGTRGAELGRAGRERAEREFGWERVLGDLESAVAEFRAGAAAAARVAR